LVPWRQFESSSNSEKKLKIETLGKSGKDLEKESNHRYL
jgi:hypothetical protein